MEPEGSFAAPTKTDDPIELSSRLIDTGVADERIVRVDNALSEIDDNVAVIEAFSNMVAFGTDDGLVCFDASGPLNGTAVVESLRRWSSDRINTLLYTHGHIDHVGGSGALAADAAERSQPAPLVVSHDNVIPRFERYNATNGYNLIINRRQFGGLPPNHSARRASLRHRGVGITGPRPNFLPTDALWPTRTYSSNDSLSVGGLDFELHHDKGETDDHTWAWVPSHRAICPGDLVVWVFPNAGNPQKVQRYPLEWARALRRMDALEPELLVPAHGPPVRGRERIATVLLTLAESLETLVSQTLDLMNEGASLDEILQSVSLPAEWLERPWMRPVYDEPEFVIRNIWRLYGGWWDLDPAYLKPSPKAELASELVRMGGGAEEFAQRAQGLAEAGDLQLACHLIELAVAADPTSASLHGVRAEIYEARRAAEQSLMSIGIFSAAAAESRDIASESDDGEIPTRGISEPC
ncbi:alkyl sulfatase dimerization domain-containing protein [Candidatus Poriferisodalis sp.]|uniref:alkyl sulfatase dimerization domain-containing protein n=1 Tax=Candidatus Poriferisodalis sp. TaxID=3101277 RepID=UPI003B02C33B